MRGGALRGERTLQEIASQYQVHPNQVGAWKHQAVEGLAELFSKGAERRTRDHESEVRDLHAKIDALFLMYPCPRPCRMALHLRREGERIGRGRAGRLMLLMGLEAIWRAPCTSAPHPEYQVWPYLLRGARRPGA